MVNCPAFRRLISCFSWSPPFVESPLCFDRLWGLPCRIGSNDLRLSSDAPNDKCETEPVAEREARTRLGLARFHPAFIGSLDSARMEAGKSYAGNAFLSKVNEDAPRPGSMHRAMRDAFRMPWQRTSAVSRDGSREPLQARARGPISPTRRPACLTAPWPAPRQWAARA